MMAPAIELIDVRKNFGKTEIIRGLTLAVLEGERHAIIGPNGAGKSTAFNLICGRIRPSAGKISLKGTATAQMTPFQISRLGLSRSFQITNIFPRLTVLDNVRCAVFWALGYRYTLWRFVDALPDVEERAIEVLQSVGLSHRKDNMAGTLGYAEQRALEIGMTLAGGADIILLDEPTAGMSNSEAERAIDLVRKVTTGRTLLMVEHDMRVVFELADRISVLANGQIIETGNPDEVRKSKAVQEAYLGVSSK